MADPDFPGTITPSAIPGVTPTGGASYNDTREDIYGERPLNVLGYQNEYDELEARRLARDEARQNAEEYHRRGMDARERASQLRQADPIGRVVQLDPSDYIGFRYVATTTTSDNGTPFDPNTYDFDRIIWQESHIDGLGNRKNVGNWEPYAAMRMNIAIIRNVIYNQYFPDGQYNPEDPADKEKVLKLKEIAHFLGKGICQGAFIQGLAGADGKGLAEATAMPVDEANRADYGAKKMYQFLLERQATHFGLPVNGLFATPAYDWELCPIVETALSDAAQQSFFDVTTDLHDVMERLHDHLSEQAESIKNTAVRAANALTKPEDLARETKVIAIEEARKILDNFRAVYAAAERGTQGKNMVEHHHEVFLPMESVSLAKYSNQLAQIYLRNVSILLQQNGGKMDADLQRSHGETVHALGRLAFATRNHAMMALSRDLTDPFFAEKQKYLTEKFGLDGAGNPLPDNWKRVDKSDPHPMLSMVAQVEKGLEEVNARLRTRLQEQSTSGINRGNEIINTGMGMGAPTVGGPASVLPHHILNSTLFANATAQLQSQAREGERMEQEFSAKHGKRRQSNAQDGNDDDMQQAQNTNNSMNNAQQQATANIQTQNQQNNPALRQSGAPKPGQKTPQQAQTARDQQQKAQQKATVQREAARQVQKIQQGKQSGAPKPATMWNGFKNKVNDIVNRNQAAQARTATPNFTPANSTGTRPQNVTNTTTGAPASVTTTSTRRPDTIGTPTPPPIQTNPMVPPDYLPPKPNTPKSRGIG